MFPVPVVVLNLFRLVQCIQFWSFQNIIFSSAEGEIAQNFSDENREKSKNNARLVKGGFSYIGQEANAVGVLNYLKKEDIHQNK